MAKTNIYLEQSIPSPLQLTWRKFRDQHVALLALGVVLAFVVLAVLGIIISPHDPYAQNSEVLLLPPSWTDGGDVSYFLGTDDLGRDIFSRLIYGSQLTLGTSLITVLIAMLVGSIIGTLSGLTSGVKSSVLNHVLDVLQSIPSLLLAIIIVAILGPGLQNAMWAIALALVPQFIHQTRNLVRIELTKEYITAARLDGANTWQVLRFSLLPNITESIILQTTMALSIAILDITALGFLGLGAQSPSSEWGAMLSGGLELIYLAPWTAIMPGLCIVLIIAAVNIVGDGLRRALKNRRER